MIKKITYTSLLLTALSVTAMEETQSKAEFHNKSLAIIKAAVERDGDTMIEILNSTPVEKRKFYLNIPEYDFGYDYKAPMYFSWYKVYNNYFDLVNVGKRLGMINKGWRISSDTGIPHLGIGKFEKGKWFYQLQFKDSKSQLHTYAIDKPTIQEDHNGGSPTRIKPTRLILATYAGDIKNIEQELLKPVDQDELIHSLFIGIDQNCFDCLQLLLSKKEVLKNRDNEKNCGLYFTLLDEISKRKNINLFELLIKENPLNCLNTPMRYPSTQLSDLWTIIDLYSWLSGQSDDRNKKTFYKQCAEICKKYEAKTLKELVQEGYAVPPQPENPYAQYFPGFIHD